MKNIISLVLVAILALICCLPCLAVNAGSVDMGYEGVLDSKYETSGVTSGDSSSARTAVTGNISYDSTTGLYYFTVSDIAKPFTANVTDGMIVTGEVNLTCPEGISAELYKDGELYDGDISTIKEKGNYVYRVTTNKDTNEQILSFTIVNSVTGLISGYTLPTGFAVESLYFNGEAKSASSSYIPFDEDGKYSLTYRCTATRKVYTLNVTIDHTPPEITLEGVENGCCRGPVEIVKSDTSDSVAVYRDGEQETYTQTLTKSGVYTLIVTDEAGNKSTYEFTILIYLNYGSWIFLGAVLLIILAVTVALVFSKKRLRIR